MRTMIPSSQRATQEYVKDKANGSGSHNNGVGNGSETLIGAMTPER